jgi:flagellar biosynthesis protein FlhF
MRLKTYTAATMSEAMQMIRRELGEDAIIVSTHSERGKRGARVTAAIEDDDPPAAAAPPVRSAAVAPTPPPATATEIIETALAFHRLPESLRRDLAATAATYTHEGPLLALAAALDSVVTFQPFSIATQARPVLLAGPPGAGKTLTAAKLILRARQGGRGVAAVSTDNQRAGGLEQLEAFTRLLGVSLAAAEDPLQLAEAVGRRPGELVIIDTAGCNPFEDADLDALAQLAIAADAEPVFVIGAGADSDEVVEMAERFLNVGCGRMVMTRIDVARRLGALVCAAEATGLAIADVGTSAQIADGLNPINPVSLARLLLPEAATAASASASRKAPR